MPTFLAITMFPLFSTLSVHILKNRKENARKTSKLKKLIILTIQPITRKHRYRIKLLTIPATLAMLIPIIIHILLKMIKKILATL